MAQAGSGVLIAACTATFEQLGKAVDDAFTRWDHNHLHEFTLADGTVIIPVRWWDGEEPEGSLDGAKARLGRLIGQGVVTLPVPFKERGDHAACRLSGAVRVLLERGQHPVTEGLQAILRCGRTPSSP